MRNHLFFAQLFNQPLLVTPDVLAMATEWAARRMGFAMEVDGALVNAMKGLDDDIEMESQSDRQRRTAAETGVAVIAIHGALVPRAGNLRMCQEMMTYDALRARLDAAVNDPAIEHIVFDVDTNGGAVTGCFELASAIAEASKIKPTTALVYYRAYSAGYLLAAGCNEIVVSQTSGVGSIGVIAKHADFSKQLESEGIKVTTVFRGARKADLSPEAPISDEALARLEQEIDGYYSMFVDHVAACRNLKPEAVRATEADVFRGAKAVKNGLADRVEEPKAALARIVADVGAKRSQAGPKAQRSIRAQAAAMSMAAAQ